MTGIRLLMQRLNSTPALRPALLFLSVVLAAGADVFGQEQGRISGVVRNAAGASVPGVTITFTNQVTSESRSARTGPDGSIFDSIARRRLSRNHRATLPGQRLIRTRTMARSRWFVATPLKT